LIQPIITIPETVAFLPDHGLGQAVVFIAVWLGCLYYV